MSEHPELDKLLAVTEESQTIGEFIETAGYTLGHWDGEKFVPTNKTINQILADYFEIDLMKVEMERRVILERLAETADVV